jgi:hypothetical protein
MLVLLGAACADDFTPRSVLEDLRVLAIQTCSGTFRCPSPVLEVGPGESVTLTPVRLAPPGVGATITEERWSFCPFSVGATAGFACAVPACEFPLHPDGSPSGDPVFGVTVTADPGALAQRCLEELAAQGGAPPSVPSELPPKVNTVFRYRAAASDGSTREAIQLVPFHLGGAPAVRNLPPVIQTVRFWNGISEQAIENGGTRPIAVDLPLAPGRQLEVTVLLDPASLQTYVDDAGRTLTETLIVSFFTTAGRFDFDRSNVDFPAEGPGAGRVVLKYEAIREEDVEAQLWVLATDLRGGETVDGPFLIPIQHD